MAESSIPKIQFLPSGVSAPLESAVLDGARTDINASFGGGLNMDARTPQGQMATTYAALIGDRNAEFLALVNGMDPAYAEGRMQDAIVRLNFLTRKEARATTAVCRCTGLPGTLIPANSLARDVSGNIYRSTTADTIEPVGYVDILFECTITGPVPCPPNSITTVYRIVPGWDLVTNPDAGTEGANAESAAELETRRQASVAKNARGYNAAMRGALLDLPGVVDALVFDNPTNAPMTTRGVTLGAHQLYVGVVGGEDDQVARVINDKKAPGCPYYEDGNTAVLVEDDRSGYLPPYPQYTVIFERVQETPAFFSVSIRNSPEVPNNAEALVRQAMIDAFRGLDGVPKRGIGATLYAAQFYSAVASLGAWARVIEITVGLAASPTGVTQGFDADQIPSLSEGDIALVLV